MTIHWYAHHLGDYAKKTSSLSLIEHGAYRLLLDYYYTIGGPIPNDMPILYRVCRALNRHERGAVLKILSKYFVPQHGCWHNDRCDQEIKERYERSDIAKKKANKRWKVNMPQHMPETCKPTTYNLQPYSKKGNGHAKQTGSDEGNRLAEEYLNRKNNSVD